MLMNVIDTALLLRLRNVQFACCGAIHALANTKAFAFTYMHMVFPTWLID